MMSDRANEPLLVALEHLTNDAQRLLADSAQSPNQLLGDLVARIVAVEPGVSIVFTGDFVASVQQRFDREGIGASYDVVRGINTAVAKAMKSASGSVEILINADLLMLSSALSSAEVRAHIMLLQHMGVHEAVHAAHMLRGEDAETISTASGATAGQAAYYSEQAGILIEEYRAELWAEICHPHPNPSVDSIAEDLDHFDEMTKTARDLSRTDVPAAAALLSRALMNWWKALAFMAAQARAGARALPTTLTSSAIWVQHDIWEQLSAVLDQLPVDPSEVITTADLISITGELMALLPQTYARLGVERQWDDDIETMWWIN